MMTRSTFRCFVLPKRLRPDVSSLVVDLRLVVVAIVSDHPVPC